MEAGAQRRRRLFCCCSLVGEGAASPHQAPSLPLFKTHFHSLAFNPAWRLWFPVAVLLVLTCADLFLRLLFSFSLSHCLLLRFLCSNDFRILQNATLCCGCTKKCFLNNVEDDDDESTSTKLNWDTRRRRRQASWTPAYLSNNKLFRKK